METEVPAALIFQEGVPVGCPRCPEPQFEFKKEVGTLKHLCPVCETLYENPEQVIAEVKRLSSG